MFGRKKQATEEQRYAAEANRRGLTLDQLRRRAAEVGGNLNIEGNLANIVTRRKGPGNAFSMSTVNYLRSSDGTWSKIR